MVALRPTDFSKVSKIINDPEYAWSMNFGDCTIAGGVLQIDHRGEYPAFTPGQIDTIAKEGFERADTHWYEITPLPQKQTDKKTLLDIFNAMPSSTVISGGAHPSLQVSFTSALTKAQMDRVNKTEMRIQPIATVPLRVAL